MLKGMRFQLLLAFSIFGITAALAGAGTFATSNDTRKVTGSIDSAPTTAVKVEVNDVANNDSTFVDAVDMLPGDTAVRIIKLENVGSENWQSAYMSTYVASGDTSSLLDTDQYQGLQMKVERCTTFGGTGPTSYTCAAVDPTAVVESGPVIRSNLPLGSTPALTKLSSDYLKFTFTLPSYADDSFENKLSKITIRFTAVQRDPESK